MDIQEKRYEMICNNHNQHKIIQKKETQKNQKSVGLFQYQMYQPSLEHSADWRENITSELQRKLRTKYEMSLPKLERPWGKRTHT